MITEKTAAAIGEALPELNFVNKYEPSKHLHYLRVIEHLIDTKCTGKVLLRNLRDYIMDKGLEHGILTCYHKEGERYIPQSSPF